MGNGYIGSLKFPSRTRKKGKRGFHLKKSSKRVENASNNSSSTNSDSSMDNLSSTSVSGFSPNERGIILQGFHENLIPVLNVPTEQCYVVERNAYSVKNAKLSLTGRRIVDVLHFIEEIWKISSHPVECKQHGMMVFRRESRLGLVSKLVFECDRCSKTVVVATDSVPVKGNEPSINKAAVWGFTSVGSGHAQQDEIFSVLGIPSLSQTAFIRTENKVGKYWGSTLDKAIEDAGLEEKRLAIQAGDIDPDGIPFITVTVDGGWSQRSYGHRYTAKSGCAVIIGTETKKLLFLGIRNKYCSICVTESRINEKIKHECYRNWTQSSTAMESDIIVEGFNKSIMMHGIRYKKMIGDGDSSVLKNIIEKVPYGRDVEKIECANHAVRCYTSALHKLAKNGSHAKLLSKSRIKRLAVAARVAIRRASDTKQPVSELKRDLENGPKHVYGCHDLCQPSFCNPAKYKAKTLNLFGQLPPTLRAGISSALEYLIRKADKIKENHTSNLAETYMNIVSKFIGHKQFFRGRRYAFNGRTNGAGLTQIYGSKFHENTWKNVFGKSPSVVLKKYTTKLSKKRLLTRRRLGFAEVKKNRRVAKAVAPPSVDVDYGPNCQQPDYDGTMFDELKSSFLSALQLSESERLALERRTVLQSSSKEWVEERRKRLTASKFGVIAKMRETTSCASNIRSIIYPNGLITDGMQYGMEHESDARMKYESEEKVKVLEAGLFVEKHTGILAASPDGIVPNDGLIEIKCPITAVDNTFEELAKKSSFCSTFKDGKLTLKRTHNYYYQIQGQLLVAEKTFCDFILWSETEYYKERIFFDKEFCRKMVIKLKRFYYEALLPELVHPRSSRNMPLREAPYVVEAKRKTEELSNQASTSKKMKI